MNSIEDLYNELSQLMSAVELAEFVATNPSIDAWIKKLDELTEPSSQNTKSPYAPVWVTDVLVDGRKEYKRAK